MREDIFSQLLKNIRQREDGLSNSDVTMREAFFTVTSEEGRRY
jgi:hypothetical protein